MIQEQWYQWSWEPYDEVGMNKSRIEMASKVKDQVNMLSFILRAEDGAAVSWPATQLLTLSCSIVWHFVFSKVSPQCYLWLSCSSLLVTQSYIDANGYSEVQRGK